MEVPQRKNLTVKPPDVVAQFIEPDKSGNYNTLLLAAK